VEVALIIVVGYLVLAGINSWIENVRRLRCGARIGLFGRCPTPVDQPALRCARHRGMPRRMYP
jgi:hypothetical protein